MSDEDRQRAWAAIQALEADMKSSGAWVLSVRLASPADAFVVRSKRDGGSSTDGPYAETKEQLGGFYLIEATDREEARTWADRVSATISMPIEVRELADWSA
jgi:hypothetical protein